MAVVVEDHPIEYGEFEGVIPQKEYGDGTVMLWDTGTWIRHGATGEGGIDIELRGSKLKGRWTLVRTSAGQGGNKGPKWLLVKRRGGINQRVEPDDLSVVSGRTMDEITKGKNCVWMARKTVPPVSAYGLTGTSGRASIPDATPQLAVRKSQQPVGERWLHEITFDGYRLMAELDRGKVRLLTRNGNDWSHRLPTLAGVILKLPVTSALFDGEIIMFGQEGTTSFRKLQERVGGWGDSVREEGLVFQVSDLLYLDGHDLRHTPLSERKSALKAIVDARPLLAHDPVCCSDHFQGDGSDFLTKVCEMGLEGVISKSANASYRSGREAAWIKTKCIEQDEFVVGGYMPPSGSRTSFGSLLLGAYGGRGFEYQGRVGTGFSSRQLEWFHKQLQNRQVESRPFAEPVPESQGARWVRPELVVVESAQDLVYLAQFGVIELHPWGSRIEHVETPDIITFDFDPDPSLDWQILVTAARSLNALLQQAGLTGFPRTTGGKGLHVVVPVEPEADWDIIKQFARLVAGLLARQQPKVLNLQMAKARRKGRIFLDYLRNGRGATSVASYSVRASAGAPVATPLRWDEVSRVGRGDRYTVESLPRRLPAPRDDPWAAFESSRSRITLNTLEKLEVQT